MDLNKIFIKGACPTKVGGQAVLEGIMMKGADRTAVAIRKPNGRIHIRIKPLPTPSKIRKIPFLRGVFVFVDALVEGTKTLLYSAEVLEDAEDEEGNKVYEDDKLTLWLNDKFGEKAAFNLMIYFSVFISLLFTVGIFIIGPTFAVDLLGGLISNEVVLNLVEGVFRILLFVIYVWLISKMKDIQTVFRYHGAEHKTIHCFENGLELTPANCRDFPTLHPRCGTSFLMFVFIISLLLFSLLGWPNLVARVVSRLLLIPVIAGVSFELLRWAGSSESWIVKILSLPGLAMQKLSTMQPDDSQLEVAIAAMKAVLNTDGPREFTGETDMSGELYELAD